MRAGLVISVLVVMGLAALVLYAWHRAVQTARAMAQEAIASAGRLGTETSRATESFGIAGKTQLAVVNDYGSIEVSAGGPDLKVERVIFTGQDDAARARAKQFRVEVAAEGGDGRRVRVVGERGRRRAWVNLMVQAPPGLDLTVEATSGDVEVSSWTGTVNASAGSGNVALRSIAGAVVAKTALGDIRAENLQGGVVAQTGSGNIELSLVRGRAYGKAVSGNVTFADVEADAITAEAGSGDVSLEGVSSSTISVATHSGDARVSVKRPFSGSMEVHAGSGNARLALPASSDCRIQAKAVSGTVTNGLTMQVTRMSESEMSGSLGAGKGSVEVTTTRGNIELTEAGGQ